MSDIHKELEETPTHEDIQKRAYELYLKSREEFSAKEYWLIAEEELRRERADKSAPIKSPSFTARQSELLSSSDKDFLIAEEELTQVRVTEQLKEGREGFTLPRSKAVAVVQQKTK